MIGEKATFIASSVYKDFSFTYILRTPPPRLLRYNKMINVEKKKKCTFPSPA